jgi:hypothetical protein
LFAGLIAGPRSGLSPRRGAMSGEAAAVAASAMRSRQAPEGGRSAVPPRDIGGYGRFCLENR